MGGGEGKDYVKKNTTLHEGVEAGSSATRANEWEISGPDRTKPGGSGQHAQPLAQVNDRTWITCVSGKWSSDATRRGNSSTQERTRNYPAGTRCIKKSYRHLFTTPGMRYQFIAENLHEYPVRVMCRALEVSESGYYAWKEREASEHKREDARIAAEIQQIFQEHRQIYGSPRIHAVLAERGIHCGRKRVVRLMQALGLSAFPKKRRSPQTTKSNPRARFAPNLLESDFTADAPNTKWVTDCTMIPTTEGWLYLAVVLDLYSRRVVGWAMGATENEELVTLALRMALARRRPQSGCIILTEAANTPV